MNKYDVHPFIPLYGIYLVFRYGSEDVDHGIGNPSIHIASAVVQALSIGTSILLVYSLL